MFDAPTLKMEAKAAKIGMIILIATVVFRFALTDEQKAELYSIFSSVDRDVNDFDFNRATFETQALTATLGYSNDYSGIRTKEESRRIQEQLLAQSNVDEDVPSDYLRSNDFEMFTYLNNQEVTYTEVEEEYTEPLESYNTINASMSLFFPQEK